jgi:hypothetical protein
MEVGRPDSEHWVGVLENAPSFDNNNNNNSRQSKGGCCCGCPTSSRRCPLCSREALGEGASHQVLSVCVSEGSLLDNAAAEVERRGLNTLAQLYY